MTLELQRTLIVILAGGLGTRLRSTFPDIPKGLAPVGDRPFLELQIGLLRSQGARHFLLCIGLMADAIRDTLGDGTQLGVEIKCSFEKRKLLGTAGALKNAQDLLPSLQPFIVLNGDTYLPINYQELLHTHNSAVTTHNAFATIAICQVDRADRYGSVQVGDNGLISHFEEKREKRSNTKLWVSAGSYVIEPRMLKLIPPSEVSSLERNIFPTMLHAGHLIRAYRCAEPFFDIGTPQGWRQFSKYYAKELQGAGE